MVENIPVRGTNIIAVDDNRPFLKLLVQEMNYWGYGRVEAFDDPLQALARVQAQPGDVDLVMTNWGMAKMDGITLAQHLREIRGDIVVVLYTGGMIEEAQQRDYSKAVDIYLPVPFSLIKMGATLTQATRLLPHQPRE